MDSKLTRQEILNLYGGLRAVSSMQGSHFAYAVIKNFRKLSGVIKDFKFPDKQKEYEDKRNVILAEGPSPEIDQDKKLEDLNTEYAETLKETEAYLAEEVSVTLHLVPFSSVPSTISATLLEPILPIIEGELDK